MKKYIILISFLFFNTVNAQTFDNIDFIKSKDKNEYLKQVITQFQNDTRQEHFDGEHWLPYNKQCKEVVSFNLLNEFQLVKEYQVKCSNFNTDVVVSLMKVKRDYNSSSVESCRYYGQGRPKSEQCK